MSQASKVTQSSELMKISRQKIPEPKYNQQNKVACAVFFFFFKGKPFVLNILSLGGLTLRPVSQEMGNKKGTCLWVY
jgi:hypothetical protein